MSAVPSAVNVTNPKMRARVYAGRTRGAGCRGAGGRRVRGAGVGVAICWAMDTSQLLGIARQPVGRARALPLLSARGVKS